MRVIAGQWRGRKLVAPGGIATRPTADRTRETLFSMFASRIGSFEELRVADLFAGSGALGIEALSRGAAFACFVEQDRAALDAIRSNLSALGALDRSTVRATSALKLPRTESFELVFADPPYASGSGTAAARAVVEADWLKPGGWLAVETARADAVTCDQLIVEAERDVGRARITLLRRES
jgi:16S rRNA (guanine966-N2)-methyltransferase